MRRLREVAVIGVLACIALVGAGCNDQELIEKQQKIDELQLVNVQYEKQMRDLTAQLEELKVRLEQSGVDLEGKNRELNKLLGELGKPRRGGSAIPEKTMEMLRYIAREVGGEVVGNRILLPSDFFFASGSWALSSEAKGFLKRLSSTLDPAGLRLVLMIVGHTDNEPIKKLKAKGVQTNRQLSLYRSLAVLEYLQQAGYPADLMYPTGWGELKPVASNDSAAGRKRNRRVEIYIDPELSNLIKSSSITGVGSGGVEGGYAPPAYEEPVQSLPPMEKPPVRFTK